LDPIWNINITEAARRKRFCSHILARCLVLVTHWHCVDCWSMLWLWLPDVKPTMSVRWRIVSWLGFDFWKI